jgi:hypothetical protein
MDITRTELSIPNPRTGGDLRLRYSLNSVRNAEDRVHEIAIVTPTKGPELLSVFSLALKDLSDHLPQLHYQSTISSKKRRERRAVVVLEVVPRLLAEKKLTNNETNREAIVEQDPEFSVLTDVEAEIEAAYIYVREKYRTIESHLNAVKKSMDAGANMLNFLPNPNLVQVPNQEPTNINGVAVGRGRYQ